MATVCTSCACTLCLRCVCSVCVVCAPAQEVVERSGQTVSYLCERSREESWAHQWLCLRDQHCIVPPLMLYQYLIRTYVALPHHLCIMLFCIHVSILRSLWTANLPLVSSSQRPLGLNVLLASTLNSCAVAHQFAISVSQRNHEPLRDHPWERICIGVFSPAGWLLVGWPLHSLTANPIVALPCSSGYPSLRQPPAHLIVPIALTPPDSTIIWRCLPHCQSATYLLSVCAFKLCVCGFAVAHF